MINFWDDNSRSLPAGYRRCWRPLECSRIGGQLRGPFRLLRFLYRSFVRGDVDYVANHGVCDSRLGCCPIKADPWIARAEGLWVSSRTAARHSKPWRPMDNAALPRADYCMKVLSLKAMGANVGRRQQRTEIGGSAIQEGRASYRRRQGDG